MEGGVARGKGGRSWLEGFLEEGVWSWVWKAPNCSEGWKVSLASGPEGLQASPRHHPQQTRPASHPSRRSVENIFSSWGCLEEVEGIGHHQVAPVEAGRGTKVSSHHFITARLQGPPIRVGPGGGGRRSSGPGASPRPLSHAQALGFRPGPTPPAAPKCPSWAWNSPPSLLWASLPPGSPPTHRHQAPASSYRAFSRGRTPKGPGITETLVGAAAGSYLTPPVVLGDGDVVAAHAADRAGGSTRTSGQEVPVPESGLRILPAAGPPVMAGTLNPGRPPARESAHPTLIPWGGARLG